MNKNTSLRSDDKKMVPQGWETVVLADIGMIRSSTVDPSKFPEQTFELWSVPSYPSGKPELLLGSEIGSTKQIVQEGDVLLCKINPRINRVWRVGPKGSYQQIASSEWILFRNSEIDPDFLMHRMKEGAFREKLCADVSGVGGSLTRARPISVKKIEIDVAPNKEQARIVTAIESLQQRSARARALLTEVHPLLVNLRQSILQAAFSGRLTADWRAKNPDVEPADQLLARIRTERRQRWETAELAKYEAKGKKPPKNWEDKYKEPEPVDDSELPELPDGWCWVALEEIADRITDGTHQSPKFTDSGVPFLVIRNVISGIINWDEVDKWVSEETYEENTARCRPEKGDVLYTAVGSYGTAVFVESNSKFMFQRHIAHIKPTFTGQFSEYIAAVLNSNHCKKQADLVARGVAQKTVTLGSLRRFFIPLAPVEEQHKIIKAIKTANSIVKKIDVVQAFSSKSLSKLDQSILSKAFRGELVPQDPNDEPASELLARIKAERDGQSGQSKVSIKKQTSRIRKKEGAVMPKSRFDDEVKHKPYLASLLKERKILTSGELYEVAELSLPDFYKQLDWEVENGIIGDNSKTLEVL